MIQMVGPNFGETQMLSFSMLSGMSILVQGSLKSLQWKLWVGWVPKSCGTGGTGWAEDSGYGNMVLGINHWAFIGGTGHTRTIDSNMMVRDGKGMGFVP